MGHKFVSEWKMVWEEILIGFTIAGFMAVFVPAATFIGSMGNIPLATVLSANGVLFAGLMGFIHSDLMVPPLVAIVVAGMVALHFGHVRGRSSGVAMDMGNDTWDWVKRLVAYLSVVLLLGGLVSCLVSR